MKKLLKLSVFLTLFSFCAVFTGCKKEGFGDFSVSVREVGPDYVDLFVTAPSKMQMYYKVSEEELIMNSVVLANPELGSTEVTVSPAQILRIKKGIESNKTYFIYVTGNSGNGFEDVQVLKVTTKKYSFSETIKIVETYYDGFKAHVTMPKSVKDAGNVLRYGYTSLATYNKMTKMYGTTDVERLIGNGNIYGRYIKNDSTFVYNSENVYEVVDGEELDIHDDIFPNEPGVFLVGEFRWGASKEEIEQETGFAGWNPSYIIPLYDWQTGKWYGTFEKLHFTAATPPDELVTDFSIDVYDVTQLDATVYFNFDENVYQCMYMIMDDNVYNTMLDLCGGEENVQWFIASTNGYFEGASMLVKSEEINAVSTLVDGEVLAKNTRYRVLANAWGDAKGTKQKFVVKEFITRAATKPKPVIQVTPVETGDPYWATFNIKSVPDKNGNIQPIEQAYYAVNYTKEWQLMFNTEATYESLLKGNYQFDADDLAKINSPEGLDFTTYTLDGEVTRMAVYGRNDEHTYNEVDPADPTAVRAWADYVAPYAVGDGPAASYDSVLEKVEGVWTATATLRAKQIVNEETGDTEYYNVKHSSRVEISASMPELPKPLADSVYTIYGSKADQVDGMYEELELLCDMFEENRLKSHSRILCTGFIDFDYDEAGRNDWLSPYDLFVDAEYVSVDVAQLINDFGPKWFLEVQDDGSVIVPFNSYFLPPMHAYGGYPFYVGGVSGNVAVLDATDAHPGFPVEISEDGNTITIKPIEFDDNVLYMNSIGMGENAAYGEYEIVAAIISEIKLTKGWNGSSKRPEVQVEKVSARAATIDGSAPHMPVVNKVRSMTPLKPVKCKVIENANVVTMEKLDAFMEHQVEKQFGKIER